MQTDEAFTKSRICSLEQSAVISDLKTQVIVKYPINLVNRRGFQQLIAYLEPGYCLPSDTHFTHLVEYKYVAVKVKVRELLEHQVDCLAILADMWTTIAINSYLIITTLTRSGQ